MNNNIIGRELAFFYLIKKGHKVLLRDYECELGNVALVSKDKGELVFSDVVVNGQKPKPIKKVGEYYLKRYGIQNVQTRFDVVSVTLRDGEEPTITS